MASQSTARQTFVRRTSTGTGATLALAAAAVAATGGSAQADERYTVRAGDTVSHVALRSDSTVRAIVRANGLDARASIRIGQVLTIPTGDAKPAPKPAAAPKASHTVVAGDTVGALANRYGTSVAKIVAANGLDSRALIRIGQKLTIPGAGGSASSGGSTAAKPAAAAGTHTVRTGDTVGALATRYGTSVAKIVAANGLDSRALIRIGQKLTIPGAAASPTSKPLVGSTFEGRTYSDTVVGAANANKATLLAAGVPSKATMQALVVSTARAMGVDPALAQAVAFQESGFNHTAVSPANAIGTMQVIPTSGEWASDLVGRKLNLLDPKDNVTAGVAILRSLVRTSPDLPSAIAGYYQGASSVKKYGMFADTRRYVANIQTHMVRFR